MHDEHDPGGESPYLSYVTVATDGRMDSLLQQKVAWIVAAATIALVVGMDADPGSHSAFHKTLSADSTFLIHKTKPHVSSTNTNHFKSAAAHTNRRHVRDSWLQLPRKASSPDMMFSEMINASQIKTERNETNTTEFSTIISIMEEILGLVPSQKELRASGMLCSLREGVVIAAATEAIGNRTRERILHCTTTDIVDLHALVFQNAECLNGSCERILKS